MELRLGEPFDWSPSLRDDQVNQIAQWARETARWLGGSSQLMALARISGLRGPAHCMPFHAFTSASTSTREIIPRGHGRVAPVHDPGELRELPRNIAGIRLRPRAEYVRDLGFLREVATVSRAYGVPVYFEGSRLGHSRFVLERHGATVIPGDQTWRAGLPVLARTPGGLMRLRELDSDLACRVLSAQLGDQRSEAKSKSLQEARSLAERVVAGGAAHPNFPSVAVVRDDLASQLPATEDRPGQPARFMDDARDLGQDQSATEGQSGENL